MKREKQNKQVNLFECVQIFEKNTHNQTQKKNWWQHARKYKKNTCTSTHAQINAHSHQRPCRQFHLICFSFHFVSNFGFAISLFDLRYCWISFDFFLIAMSSHWNTSIFWIHQKTYFRMTLFYWVHSNSCKKLAAMWFILFCKWKHIRCFFIHFARFWLKLIVNKIYPPDEVCLQYQQHRHIAFNKYICVCLCIFLKCHGEKTIQTGMFLSSLFPRILFWEQFGIA